MSQELRSYDPSFRDDLRVNTAWLLDALGAPSYRDALAKANDVISLLDLAPITGTGLAAVDTKDALDRKDYVGAGLAGLGLAASILPGGGRATKEIAKEIEPYASRLARAEELGFHTGMPLYHGTDASFPAFDLAQGGTTSGAAPSRLGIWAATDPETAAEYADQAAKSRGGSQQVYPLLHRAEKPGVLDLDGSEMNHEIASTLADAFDSGHDAVMLRNYTTPSGKTGKKIVVVRDPNQLRSRFARFDPASVNSRDLLAGLAGASVGVAALSPDQSEAAEMPDLARIKRNVAKMASMDAPEADIDDYIASEGVTVDDVRNFNPPSFADANAHSLGIKGDEPAYFGPAMNATAGLNEGLYSILGAPVDMMAHVVNRAFGDVAHAAGKDYKPVEPVLGTEWIGQQMGKLHPALDPGNTVASDTGDRIARGAGVGAGMMVAPEAAIGGLARTGAISDKAANAAARMFGRSESAPHVLANAGVGATAGAGTQIGEQAAPDNLKPMAGLLGGLAGGGIGIGAASIPALAREGGRIAGNLTAPMREAGREGLAADRLRSSATDMDAVRGILDNPSPELVPGSKPTTFQMTGDMGLGALERGAQSKNPELFNQRRADQNTARIDAMTGIQPKGAPEKVATALRDHVNAIDARLSAAEDQATKAAQAKTDAVGNPIAPEAAGTQLRDALETARNNAKAQERALWDAVDPDGSLALPASNTKQKMASIFEEMPASAKPPSGEEASVYEVLGQYGNVVPFRELTALQSRLKTEMRTERLANGETPAYRRMSQLNSAIESDLDTAVAGKVAQEQQAVAAGQMNPDQTTAFRIQQWQDDWHRRQAQARASDAGGIGAYGGGGSIAFSSPRGTASQAGGGVGYPPRNSRLSPDDLQPNFDQDALDRLNAARDATRERANTFDNRALAPIRQRPSTVSPYNMPASVVPGRVLYPGPKGFEAVQTYRNAVGDPEAMRSLEGYAVDRLRSSAMRPDGTLDPNRVQSFRRQYKDALRAFPELDSRLADAETASRTMGDVAARRKATMDEAQKGALGRIMGLDHPEDVTRAIGGLFGRQDSIQQIAKLRKAIGNSKPAQNGLRKAIADYVTNRFVSNTEAATTGQGLIKSDQFQTFVKNNRNSLRAAGFSKEEVDLLDRIAQDLQRSNRSLASVKIPGQSNTVQDALQVQKGDSAPTMLTKILAGIGFAGGGMAGGWMGGAAGAYVGQLLGAMRQAGFQSVDDIVADAMLNPGRAKLLLSKPTGKAEETAWKTLAQMYRRAGVTSAVQATSN